MTSPFPNPGPVEMALRERAAGARARLMGPGERKRIVIPPPQHARPVASVVKHGVPVDLLTAPTWKVPAKLVALRHGVHMRDLTGFDLTRPVVAARFDAIHLVFTHCSYSKSRIAGYFGGRDHTTILNAVKTVERRRAGIPMVPRGVRGHA